MKDKFLQVLSSWQGRQRSDSTTDIEIKELEPGAKKQELVPVTARGPPWVPPCPHQLNMAQARGQWCEQISEEEPYSSYQEPPKIRILLLCTPHPTQLSALWQNAWKLIWQMQTMH